VNTEGSVINSSIIVLRGPSGNVAVDHTKVSEEVYTLRSFEKMAASSDHYTVIAVQVTVHSRAAL
jgi:hypothetical protein